MTITTHEQVCEGNWHARSFARFWEPGVEEFARKKLYLPETAHITAADYDRLRIAPYREQDGPIPGNQLVKGTTSGTGGLRGLWQQLVNGTKDWSPASGTQGFTGLAVGTGTTPDSSADTDLAGGSKAYRVCDNTYPLLYPSAHPVSGQPALTEGECLFGVTFASGEANFSWDEYAVLVPNASATALLVSSGAVAAKPSNYGLLNRKSPAGLGIKANGAPASLYVKIAITSS